MHSALCFVLCVKHVATSRSSYRCWTWLSRRRSSPKLQGFASRVGKRRVPCGPEAGGLSGTASGCARPPRGVSRHHEPLLAQKR